MKKDANKNKILHNKVLTKLSSDWIVGTDLGKFQMNSWSYLKTLYQRNKKDAGEICNELEKKGLLRPGDYTVLKELVQGLHVEILDIIKDTESEMGIDIYR